jgi:hypothetical protein
MRIPLVLGLVFCAGCAPKQPNQIDFIIPNGFHGTIILRHDPDSPPLPKIDGRYVVRLPESGVLSFGGYDPFVSCLYTAQFANGDPIWVSTRFGDSPKPGQVALLGGHTHVEGDMTGTQTVDLRWFVGTEEQWKHRAR